MPFLPDWRMMGQLYWAVAFASPEAARGYRRLYSEDQLLKLYCCTDLVASAVLPIASPEMTISTRRFCWRPSGVSLEATGSVFPKPRDSIESAEIPCCTK